MKPLLCAVLVACGSSHPPAHEQAHALAKQAPPDALADAPPDVPSDAPPGPPPACPTSFAAAAGSCAVRQDCAYPEGTCACEPAPRCSGRVPSREQQAAWERQLSWDCTAKPPAIRPDGCPGLEPGTHQTCKTDGKVCEYSRCISETYTCSAGMWVRKQGQPPP